MNHALAILAAPVVYCIHGRIIHRASKQTLQNGNEKHTPSQWLPQQTRLWPGLVTRGGELAWRYGRDATWHHLYGHFVSFTSLHYSYNHHAGTSHTDFRRRSLSRLTCRLSRHRLPFSRGASPADGVGSAARANQHITSWPSAAGAGTAADGVPDGTMSNWFRRWWRLPGGRGGWVVVTWKLDSCLYAPSPCYTRSGCRTV